ncbi:MAG TPA: hypothetical protein VN660_13020 [Steroidobacteraceae bacterium]|nr:hypothetical protein [Steroidobacteraceae bacterium]
MSSILKTVGLLALLVAPSWVIAATRTVTSTSNDPATVGTLPYWLLNAGDGDIIDCSAIAGQTITLTSSLPAITKSYTINGAGITIDGAGSYQAFQVASGTVGISNLTVQNALSRGGDGGDGYSGGGGAVGGGGALYVHGGSSVTLTDSSLLNNTAQGGNGGAANNNGNAGGGGGGGFAGGSGGSALTSVSTGGGGGGHSNGGSGGSNSSVSGGSGVYFGGGGGGAGINAVVLVATVEAQAQPARSLEERSLGGMAEGVRETVKAVFRPPGLGQVAYREKAGTVLAAIYCLEVGVEAAVHPRPVSREERG